MNKKMSKFLILMLVGTINLFGIENSNILGPKKRFANNSMNKTNVNNVTNIKNIRTLKELEYSLKMIDELIKKQKARELKAKKMTKEEREKALLLKRQNELLRKQNELEYKQKLLQLNLQEKSLEKEGFVNSDKYLNLLIRMLKEKVFLLSNLLKRNIKIATEYPIKVYDIYKIGNSYRGYVSNNALLNITSLIETNIETKNQIDFELEKIKSDLSLINKSFIKANSNIIIPQLQSFDNSIQTIIKEINKLITMKKYYLNTTNKIAPEMLTISIYKRPKDALLIKEGDMITNNIQVKKIRNGYAIIGAIEK